MSGGILFTGGGDIFHSDTGINYASLSTGKSCAVLLLALELVPTFLAFVGFFRWPPTIAGPFD